MVDHSMVECPSEFHFRLLTTYQELIYTNDSEKYTIHARNRTLALVIELRPTAFPISFICILYYSPAPSVRRHQLTNVIHTPILYTTVELDRTSRNEKFKLKFYQDLRFRTTARFSLVTPSIYLKGQ